MKKIKKIQATFFSLLMALSAFAAFARPAEARWVDPPLPPDDFTSWAEAAIGWANLHLNPPTRHWAGLCLRFIANAFMQRGSYPETVQEGIWTSALDAVRALECDDENEEILVLHWENAPRGALIFFDKTEHNQHGHVGIYLGDGGIIHAYDIVRIDRLNRVRGLDRGRYVGPYIGWAFPPERWREIPPDAQAELQGRGR